MEKVENKEERKDVKPLDIDQVKMVASQLQQRCVMLENKLRSIDLTAMRLKFLFQILENKACFPKEYIAKCADEIKELMSDGSEEGEPKQEGN